MARLVRRWWCGPAGCLSRCGDAAAVDIGYVSISQPPFPFPLMPKYGLFMPRLWERKYAGPDSLPGISEDGAREGRSSLPGISDDGAREGRSRHDSHPSRNHCGKSDGAHNIDPGRLPADTFF